MNHRTSLKHVFPVSVLVLSVSSTAVDALTINLTDVGSTEMSDDQREGFEEAAALWTSLFDDPITVEVDISFENLLSGILGSTSVARTTCAYYAVRGAMIMDAGSSDEEAAVEEFPDVTIEILDINGLRDDDYVTLSTANAKALYLGTGLDTTYSNPPVGVDAEITFNTDYADVFDYDRSDGIDADKVDFVAVAAHELGHALGFFSLTDTQDLNATLTLHPNTLDLWRFPDPFATPDDGHDLDSGTRCVTSWFSDFYSDDDWHIPFSLGAYAYLTDYACDSVLGYCQADHWSDDQGNLMDPSFGNGYEQDVKDADVHAIDYIGYDASSSFKVAWNAHALAVWFGPDFLAPPSFGGRFEKYPVPPDLVDVPQPAGATVALRLGLDLDLGGGARRMRSAVGYARYQPSMPIPPAAVKPHPDVPGEENLMPAGQQLSRLPASLRAVVFVTEDTAGAKLTFRSTDSTSGALFDASLGAFGGYRLAGFVDGDGDGVEGDIDASLTLVLLAEQAPSAESPAGPVFATALDVPDNVLVVRDRAALGMATVFRRGDANGDGAVTMSDAILTLSVLFLGEGELECRDAADSNDDGQVSMADAVTTLSVLFLGVGSIPAPGVSQCGEDPTQDDLPCSADHTCK